MVVYKLTDRIPVKIGEVEFELSPLSHGERGKVLATKSFKGGNRIEDGYAGASLSIKFAVKAVKGLTYADGSDLKLEFDPDGSLSDASVSEIMQIDGSDKLMTVALNFAACIFKDPGIEGVVVDLKSVAVKKN